MFKYLRIFTVLSAVLLVGAGCSTTKVDVEKKVQDNITTSADSQIQVSYTVAKKEEKKQTNDIKKEEKKKIEPVIQVKTEIVSNQEAVVTDKVVKLAPKTVTVDIAGFNFSPAVVKIKVGDIIKWTNSDDAPHKVASNPHPAHTDLPGLVSDVLSKGDSYSFTFDKVGTFEYHCHLHPSMSATVIVE